MVICKYYRQGNCRFGQYCQFEHINTFGPSAKVESYNEEEYTAVAVAKEVLSAERGGQWLLSCFAPLKQRPCIPGMDDLSPEEVRWEMYQAQKNGMVEQAKVHFQQLCQDMKAKRDALKNPTHETIAMLKELQGASQKGKITTGGNTTRKTSNFSFATPQLGHPVSTSASNVFGNKTFGNQSNPFGGGFASQSNASIFGRPATGSNPVFGGTPNFASNLGSFGSATSTSSIFGATNSNTSTFNTGQSAQTFGTSSSIFGGGSPQSVFGQPSVFATNAQVNNVFARPQTSQSTTSVFSSGATPAPSLFSGGSTAQSNTSLFGGAKTSTANPFGGSTTLQTTNPIFGATPAPGTFSSGIFAQSKTVPAFGGAPVFGGGANFGNAQGSIFGEQPTFGGAPGNIFGGPNTTAPSFSSAAVQPANAFGVNVPAPNVNIFGTAQSTAPTISTSNAPLFGTATPTTSGPFATATSQFEATPSTAGPFSRPTFGITTGASGETFGTTVTSTSMPFGTTSAGMTFGTPTATTTPFATSTFSDAKGAPFVTTNTTATTTTANPFAPRAQQTTSPFGNFAQTQVANTVTVSSGGPFGKSPFSSIMTVAVIDDSVYSIEGQLTDDEKSMYMAERFIFGKIPLKPPIKELR